MTLRQFMYLLVFVPLGYVVYRIIPIPVINFILGFLIAGAGAVLAFVPFNDRPIDVMIKNLTKRLASPTQYFYHKANPTLYFLENLFYSSDPHQTSAHIDAQEKLSAYLSATKPQSAQDQEDAMLVKKKQSILELILHPKSFDSERSRTAQDKQERIMQDSAQEQIDEPVKKPFVTGVVINSKKTPLPGVLIYIKDQNDTPLRLLKTNPHGVFATYNKLPPGDYTFEVKDPKGNFFFDRMKLHLEQEVTKSLEFTSKELL